MKALVIGATGAVGRDLVSELLQHDCWEEIHIFVRRSCGLRDSRIKEHIIDFENPKAWEGLVKGDVLFSALGTSRKQAGSKDAQWRVDYDYQYEFARVARRNGVRELVLVSSLGADAKSSYFYMSMKGKLEKAMQELEFPSLVIMQPPALIRKKTKRMMEPLLVALLQMCNRFGWFRNWNPMKTEVVAAAMERAGEEQPEGIHIIRGQDIRTYGK